MNIEECFYRLVGYSHYSSSSCGFLDKLPVDDKWKMIGTAVVGGGILALPALYYLQKNYFSSNKTSKEKVADDVKKPLKVTVVVDGNQLRRFGDVSLGCKVLEMVKKVCSSATVELITNKDEAALFVPEDFKPIGTNVQTDGFRHLLIKIKSGIGSFKQKRIENVWKIKEVGNHFKNNRSKIPDQVIKMPVGLRFKKGLIFNEDLRTFEKNVNSKTNCLLDIQNEFLKKKLIPADIQGEYQNSLYFGYPRTASGAFDFILTVCAKEKGKEQDIDIVLVGDQMNKGTLNSQTLYEAFAKFKKKEKEIPVVKSFDIEEVELMTPSNCLLFQDNEKEKERESNGKRLHIILPGNILHCDVLRLLNAGENYVCVSGANSLTEALSAQKMISFECSERLKDFFEELSSIDGGEVFRDLAVGESSQIDYERKGKYLNDASVQTTFMRIADSLYKERNFGLFLEKQLQSLQS